MCVTRWWSRVRDSPGARNQGPRRSQSDVIGFIVVFSIVLVALVGVSAFGISALETTRDATVAESGELAMESVSADLEALFTGTASSRTTELNVESGTLATGEETRMQVTVERGGTTLTPSLDRTFRPITFESDRASIVAENTLLVRDQRVESGAIALQGPLGTFSDEHTVLPMVLTQAATEESLSGGTIQVESIVTDTSSEVFTSDASNTLNVTAELTGIPESRAAVWRRTMNERLDGMSARSPDTPCFTPASGGVRCEFETDTLVTSLVTVEYDLR